MQHDRSAKQASLLRREEGLAFVEFAIAIPVLLLILLGFTALADYLRVTKKLETSVSAMTDSVSQLSPTASQQDIQNIMNAAALMMEPYTLPGNTTYIFTDVIVLPQFNAGGAGPSGSGPAPGGGNNGGIPELIWQYTYSPGGTASYSSALGTPATGGGTCPTASLSNAAIPNPGAFSDFDEIIVGEAYYQYQPLVSQYLAPASKPILIYRSSVFFVRNLTNGASATQTGSGSTVYTFGTLTNVGFNTTPCTPQ